MRKSLMKVNDWDKEQADYAQAGGILHDMRGTLHE